MLCSKQSDGGQHRCHSWVDVLYWPGLADKYLHCKEADGTRVDDSKCHLYVDETKNSGASAETFELAKS